MTMIAHFFITQWRKTFGSLLRKLPAIYSFIMMQINDLSSLFKTMIIIFLIFINHEWWRYKSFNHRKDADNYNQINLTHYYERHIIRLSISVHPGCIHRNNIREKIIAFDTLIIRNIRSNLRCNKNNKKHTFKHICFFLN